MYEIVYSFFNCFNVFIIPTNISVQCSTMRNMKSFKNPNKYDYIAQRPAITPSIIYHIMVNHMLDAPTDPSPIGVIYKYMISCRSSAAQSTRSLYMYVDLYISLTVELDVELRWITRHLHRRHNNIIVGEQHFGAGCML